MQMAPSDYRFSSRDPHSKIQFIGAAAPVGEVGRARKLHPIDSSSARGRCWCHTLTRGAYCAGTVFR
jgi:hypothetical protein